MQIYNPLGLGYLGHDWYDKKRRMEVDKGEKKGSEKCVVCGEARVSDMTLAYRQKHYCPGKPAYLP